jgi:hypothetical protein
MVTKVCNRCKQEKPVLEFYKNAAKKDGIGSVCIPCGRAKGAEQTAKFKAYKAELKVSDPDKYAQLMRTLATEQREWQRKNPEKMAVRQRRYRYRQTGLGVTADDYDAMLIKQGGLCAICRLRGEGKKRLHVDHCHSTGKIRGLLCFPCNFALGHYRDSIELHKAAIAYLEEHGTSTPI